MSEVYYNTLYRGVTYTCIFSKNDAKITLPIEESDLQKPTLDSLLKVDLKLTFDNFTSYKDSN